MTENTTAGRVAIVTGGSSGIGREAAVRLGRDGYAVAIVYVGGQANAEEAVKEVEQAGGQAIAVQADVADETAVAALFDRTEQSFGGVDVVVHAAGIMLLAPLADLDLDDLDRMHPHQHPRHVRRRPAGGPAAARRRRDHQLLHARVVEARPARTTPPTPPPRARVEAMTLILARELRGRDITVNAVAPGPTATALFLDGKDAGDRSTGSPTQPPLERLGTPDGHRRGRRLPGRPGAAGSTARCSTPTAGSLI